MCIYYVYPRKLHEDPDCQMGKQHGRPDPQSRGDHLELAAEGSGVVRMRKRKEKQTLQDLVRGITAGNLHKETDWGRAEGNELW
jgi:hypothetical protein